VKEKNLRKAKLDKIAQKIAMFIVEETYVDEPEAQKALGDALKNLEVASVLLVKSDDDHKEPEKAAP
jgi:hypothetical protein